MVEPRRDVFQAIADPTRREIIKLIARKPLNVNTLSENFNMSRQAISLHVKILEQCGVLSVEPEGRERYCHLRPKKLAEVSRWLDSFRELWDTRFNQLDDVLKNMKTRKK